MTWWNSKTSLPAPLKTCYFTYFYFIVCRFRMLSNCLIIHYFDEAQRKWAWLIITSPGNWMLSYLMHHAFCNLVWAVIRPFNTRIISYFHKKTFRISNVVICVFRPLLKLFEELHYWEKLSFEIPHYVVDVYAKCEELRILRESVLLVVRDYNRSVCHLSVNNSLKLICNVM